MAKKKDKNIDQFKQGIFSLRTNFGELAQLMLQKDMGLHPSDDNSYDLKDDDGRRIEVKFSRAYKKDIPITASNAIELCSNSSTMVYDSTESEKRSSDYDCNIQQLKPDCFDSLYYGVFFSDKIEIFHAPRSEFPDSADSFIEVVQFLFVLGGIGILGEFEVLLYKGIVNGFQLGMDSSSVFDLGDCPHSVLVLL